MEILSNVKEVKEVVLNREGAEEVNRLLKEKWILLHLASTSKGLIAVLGRTKELQTIVSSLERNGLVEPPIVCMTPDYIEFNFDNCR